MYGLYMYYVWYYIIQGIYMYFGIYINHASKYSIYINQVNMVFIYIMVFTWRENVQAMIFIKMVGSL